MKLHDGTTLDLDDTTAMTIAIIAVDAFADAIDQIGQPIGREMVGTVLLFDALMQRIKPALPQTEKLAHVHAAIGQANVTAKVIRRTYGLPDVV